MWQILAGISVGILSASFSPVAPDPHWLWPAGMLSLFMTLLSAFRFPYFMVPAALMLGMVYGFWQGQSRFHSWVDAELTGKDLLLSGSVISLPSESGGSTRFIFQVPSGQKPSGNISLNWHDAPDGLAGQKWKLCIRLKRPNGFVSPGVRDYQAWLMRQNIIATGYVRQSPQNEMLGDAKTSLAAGIRAPISNWLTENLSVSFSGLVKALLLGDTRGLTSDDWQLFRDTGTIHLLVISGLHVSLVAMVGWVLMRGFGLLGLLPLNHIPLSSFASVCGLILALIYGALAGFGLPVQRALVMLTAGVGSLLLGFRLPIVTVLLVALISVLLIDPLAGTSSGFWLSFLAVSVLLYMFSHRKGRNGVQQLIMAQFVIAVALAPVLAGFQQPVSLLSPLVNLVSIPLVGGIVVPLMLASLAVSALFQSAGLWLLSVAGHLLEIWKFVLQWSVEYLGQVFWLPPPTGLDLIAAIVGIAIMLAPSGLGWRWLGFCCLLPWLWPKVDRPDYGTAEVAVMDVGQGLAIVVQTQKHTLVYDTGDRFPSGFTAADAVLLPWLRRHRIRSLDRIVVSHGDRDHIGGLESLSRFSPDAEVVLSEIPYDAFPSASSCYDRKPWRWDGVGFEFLHALPDGNISSNDRSCVLRICSQSNCALLTGDISSRREKQLVDKYGTNLKSEIFLVPHHGSRTSSSEQFLEAVKPDYASISSGYSNRFHHPSSDVITRLEFRKIRVLNTAQTGSQVYLLGKSLEPVCSRGNGWGWWKRKLLDGTTMQNCDRVQ
ncbi:DNA internalization-related competence protein ComEC/Rec2 [Sansalvadorimonas sp. 2012CJ34-2]|uniref:DNA internalization-related competence protein ComEC/Rec2 n=1 Tax=Parendozoicomonas callyspongiae TaxID=2942213 RepID=A0ABT0PF04_9GAMM|nr:DNA internalization-related competence protein ComEC/Rec2 [Sansalvadorimonas sp. 2012CJ34-2]MCL6269791.1 DNA internalization-related competence protein ComEC/Rec2 [Sansalvadorimonas sp. 2012CJ34-2]